MVHLQGLLHDEPEHLLLQLCCATTENAMPDFSAIPEDLKDLVHAYADLFAAPSGLPPHRACNHVIPLIPSANPVIIRPYRYSPKLKDELEQQVKEMLEQSIIQPSASLFSSPVLLVPKKDGGYRMCVDYRQLNAITMKSKFLVPIFDQLMDELSRAKWFSTLDLRAGFHHILLQPGEEPKTAFQIHLGQNEFRVMAFGLTGAPGTFQGAMNSTLAPWLRKFVLVFFDDILVYNKTREEHVYHLQQVFEWLTQDQWKLKLSKCKFAQQSISYLGHVISEQGISTDLAKIEAIQNCPVPKSVKDIREFLGLAGYYRKFVKKLELLLSHSLLSCVRTPLLFGLRNMYYPSVS